MTASNTLDGRSLAATAVFAALALTGCAADDPADPDASNPGDSADAETTAEPEPTEAPPPSAADGTDYSNCGTRCEVEVTAGVVF